MKVRTLLAFTVAAAWIAVGLYFLALLLILIVPPSVTWVVSPSESRTGVAACATGLAIFAASWASVDELRRYYRHKRMLDDPTPPRDQTVHPAHRWSDW